ncbi:MAG: hypothetical protein IKF51_02865 [Solobacterium sp.]|nr:hypothetical protein [Solobacterium sp.]
MELSAVRVLMDVAPDPVTRAFSFLPVILIAAVVILSVILLRRYFLKR